MRAYVLQRPENDDFLSASKPATFQQEKEENVE